MLPPLCLLAVLGTSSLLGKPLSERLTGKCVPGALLLSLISAVTLSVLLLAGGHEQYVFRVGSWTSVGAYELSLSLLFDRLSLPMAVLTLALSGVVGAFAHRYLHREPGYVRFFVLYALFVSGMLLTVVAGTVETLLAAWELMGLSSALLVAFFHERPEPAENGLWVWAIYRISDLGLLLAAVLWHHWFGSGDFETMFVASDAGAAASLTSGRATAIGCLLLLSAIGKSALVPVSGWLPRAMEGPTPSSAIFYGALSVHAGVYLLLRTSPVFEQSGTASALVVVVGLLTALYATIVGRVQTDVKCSFAFASLTQIGLIVAEAGLGLYFIAVFHILGHACIRTLQFLRAPSLLHDRHQLENAVGSYLPRSGGHLERLVPMRWRSWLYRFALERGYLDAWLDVYLVTPFARLFRRLDSLEERLLDGLSGESRAEGSRAASKARKQS
jgi:NAD(P)H-quinone oxidoreductase subunit 5